MHARVSSTCAERRRSWKQGEADLSIARIINTCCIFSIAGARQHLRQMRERRLTEIYIYTHSLVALANGAIVWLLECLMIT